jgi:hypothetical protein
MQAENCEIVPGYIHAVDLARPSASGQYGGILCLGCNRLERRRVRPQVAYVWNGKSAPGNATFVVGDHDREAAGVRVGQRFEQNRVEHAKNRDVGTNSKREGGDDDADQKRPLP